MEKDRLSKDVGRRLLARGLPLAEVRRYMGELRDHRQDLVDECLATGLTPAQAQSIADARLGTPRQLANAATRRFRRATFVGRHPLFFFGIVPAFAWFFMWLAFVLALMLMAYAIRWTQWVPLPVMAGIGSLCADISTIAMPCSFAMLYYRAARQRGLALGWRLFPIALAALSAAWVRLMITPQMIGLVPEMHPSIWRSLLPMTVVLLWALRHRRVRRPVFA